MSIWTRAEEKPREKAVQNMKPHIGSIYYNAARLCSQVALASKFKTMTTDQKASGSLQ
ncbi:MAG: hypothetical protein GYA55_08120 [SAR324 cluster bacterium]|uniref:Uncharacterized protein n=1 Tax=SAR324 cluster bacterium TaxID=2024889 RepID=A0A7X9ILL7_9DELT|nr:hypothetical protein [SAR324 cluster bacterium]